MNKYIYDGADINLGRFGAVRKGDVLLLTDREADTVDRDKRFKPVRGTEPKAGQFVPVTDKMTPEQRAAAEASNKAEKERLDELSKANNAATVEVNELREKSWSELVEVAEKINAEGKTKIEFSKRTSKAALIRDIMRAKGMGESGDEEESES